MQFTPQQLVGGSRYSQSVRIGNWSEDLELDSLKLQDYLSNKEHGELLVNAKQKKLEQALKPATLTGQSRELKFGTTIMLANHKSESFLSCNPFELLQKGAGAEQVCRSVTTSLNAVPCGRNTYIIERATMKDGFDVNDDCVHYGQTFKLRMLEFAGMGESYLMSEHITPLASSKFSRKQEVVMSGSGNGKCLFEMAWPDVKKRFEMGGFPVLVDHFSLPQRRFEMGGFPVLVDHPLCIKHVHTGSFLASDKIHQQNLFGNEFEVHCWNYISTNKTQNLFSESKGTITGDYPLRRQGLENIWTVVSGWSSESDAKVEGA